MDVQAEGLRVGRYPVSAVVGGNAMASRSSDFYSETALTRGRSEGWLGRARSDGGAPGSGIDRDRCRVGV